MDKAETLERIKGLAGANRIRFPTHARLRMRKRGATDRDVQKALANGTAIEPDSIAGRWRVTGQDLDGDALTVVVVEDDGIIVVTIF